MARLAPSRTPLWRTPTSLQFGIDAAARVDGVTAWQERVVDALADGIPAAAVLPLAVGFGATADDAQDFLDAIGPAMAAEPHPVQARVEVGDDVPAADARVLVGSLQESGVVVTDVSGWAGEGAGPPVVLVAARLADPRRAARLVARDVPHLPIELSGDRIAVGPFVRPGHTPCLACVHAARTDADPQWPALASQLLARGPLTTDGALLLEAATLTARLLRPEVPAGLSVAVSGDHWRRAWRVHRRHPECWCRAPSGTATAADPDSPMSAPS